jgi:hypothetical protein
MCRAARTCDNDFKSLGFGALGKLDENVTPSASSVSVAWRMVAQSDWLPMMTATSLDFSLMARPFETNHALYRIRHGAATLGSSNNVGNKLVFEPLKVILDRELLLLHPLDLQRVAAGLQHGGHGCLKIRVILFEPRKCEAHIGLFLFGHH